MTTYGTIPSSSGGSNVEYLSRAKERFKAGLGIRRPWKEMCNFRAIGLPSSFRDAISRIKTNVAYFQMNYIIIVLLILFLSLLWHPISLIVFIAMMAAWLILYFLRDEPLVIFSRTISDRVVMIVLLVITIGVLFFTNATMNILISVLVGVVIVLVHASFLNTDDLCGGDEEADDMIPSKILPKS